MILNKASILLVDDEPLVLEMFESILTQDGFSVQVAPSARDALNLIENKYFDVLVCDVKLEEFDGFDIMEIARNKSSEIGVVLITGAPSEEDSLRAEKLNASYLSKPIGFDLLLSSVEVALERSRSSAGKLAHL